MIKLKQLIIRIEPEYHRLAKVRAAEECKSLQQWMADLIREGLNEKPKEKAKTAEWGGIARCQTSDGRTVNIAKELNRLGEKK